MDLLDTSNISNKTYSGDMKCEKNGNGEAVISDKVILRTSLKKKVPANPALDKSSNPSDKNIKKRVSFIDLFANMNENDFAQGQGLDDKDENRSCSEDLNGNTSRKEVNFEPECHFSVRKNGSDGILIRGCENRRSFDSMIIQPPTPPNARHSIRGKLIE